MRLQITLCAALALILSSQVVLAQDTWQSSMSPSIKFGVRNKFGAGNQQVTFEVKGPYPKPWVMVAKVNGDTWAEATFPQDFKATYTLPGKHEWTAKVEGKTVASGEFSYAYRAQKPPTR